MGEEIEAQKGQATCLWSHHLCASKGRFKPGSYTASHFGWVAAVGGEASYNASLQELPTAPLRLKACRCQGPVYLPPATSYSSYSPQDLEPTA